jgi:hypothetical protein
MKLPQGFKKLFTYENYQVYANKKRKKCEKV